MRIAVLKFGGTSLSNKESRKHAIDKIINKMQIYDKVICVVSAMSRYPYPYSTQSLVNLVPNLNDKYLDQVISFGEVLSSYVMLNDLFEYNVSVDVINYNNNGIKTDGNYQNANIVSFDPTSYINKLKDVDIIITPGFLGNYNDNVTSLKSGGSDLSAFVIAKGMQGDVFIYSDVNGIYNKDPKRNDNAIKYNEVSFDILLELIKQGAKVMQYESIIYAKKHKMSFVFASTFTNDYGTKVI